MPAAAKGNPLWRKGGPSPNPQGRNGGGDKPWADMLRLVGYQDDRRLLRELAEVTFKAAVAGDMLAIQEIGNRLDGKPVQESHINHHRGIVDMSDQELLAIVVEAQTIEHEPLDNVTPMIPDKQGNK